MKNRGIESGAEREWNGWRMVREKNRIKERESQKGGKDKTKKINRKESARNTLERRACSNPFIRLVGRVRTGFTLDPVNPVLNKGRGEQMNPFI